MNKKAVFKELLDQFETEEMRLYCEDMIEHIPDYIFTMPSSTSGKFHNATQCKPHGQIYHIIMFGAIMNYRLALKCNKAKFNNPIQLCYGIQPMSFRFDAAMFRADEKGGIVYELAKNERLVDLGQNAFSVEKVEITKTNYVCVTKDNQPLIVDETFKNYSSKDETDCEQIKFEIERID